MAGIKKSNKCMWVMMWRNWNSHTLLVENKNSAAPLESNLATPQKVKYRVTTFHSFRYRSKKNENICPPKNVHKNIHSSIIHTWKWLVLTVITLNTGVTKSSAVNYFTQWPSLKDSVLGRKCSSATKVKKSVAMSTFIGIQKRRSTHK